MTIKNSYSISKYLSLLIVFALIRPSTAMEKSEKAFKSSKFSWKKRRSTSEIGPQVALKDSKDMKNKSKRSSSKSDNEGQQNFGSESFRVLKRLVIKNHKQCTDELNAQKEGNKALEERVQKLEEQNALCILLLGASSKDTNLNALNNLKAILELKNFTESKEEVQSKSLKAQLAAAAAIVSERKKSEEKNDKYAYIEREIPDEIIDLDKKRFSDKYS